MSPQRIFAAAMIFAAAAVSSACTQMAFFVANAPTAFGSYKRSTGLPYGQDKRQRLDVYVPSNASNRPVVVFWYGGAWTDGDKARYRFVAAALAERGFVTVLPDYRLSPAVKFPEFLEDAASAVAWVQRHAAEFGGDPRRTVLMGHSAGAYMAAFLALNDRFLTAAGAHPQWIRGFIGLSGPYALIPNTDSLRTIFADPFTTADWQPLEFVTAHAPPALLIHGLADDLVYPGHAEKLRNAMWAAGVPVQAELFPQLGHADTVAAFAWAARNRGPVLEQTVKFIANVTSKDPHSLQETLDVRATAPSFEGAGLGSISQTPVPAGVSPISQSGPSR